jgi:outer membrane protein
MRRVFVAASIAVAAVFSASAMASGVGIVNMQKVFKSAPELKNIQANLGKQFAGQRAAMMKLVKALQSDQKQLQRNQSVMKKADVDKLKSKIINLQSKLQMGQAKYQQAVIAAQAKVMSDFLGKLRNSAKNVAQKDNLDMVLVNTTVLYAKESKDVTSQVLSSL